MFSEGLGEEFVAESACSLLDALSCGGGDCASVKVGSEERYAIVVSELMDKALITVAVAKAEVEVTVCDGERDAGTMEKMGHADRITSAADGEQHLFPRGEKVLLLDVVCKTL